MKKILAILMIAAAAALHANTEGYVMLSVYHPGQIPIATTSVNGVRVNLLYGECQNLNGFDFGVAGRVRERMNGFQLCLCNIIGTDASGFQAAVLNLVESDYHGFQLACWNDISGQGGGFQMGLANTAAKYSGFQLGLFNYAGTLSGLQIGLWNMIDSPIQTCRGLPLVNFCF